MVKEEWERGVVQAGSKNREKCKGGQPGSEEDKWVRE